MAPNYRNKHLISLSDFHRHAPAGKIVHGGDKLAGFPGKRATKNFVRPFRQLRGSKFSLQSVLLILGLCRSDPAATG